MGHPLENTRNRNMFLRDNHKEQVYNNPFTALNEDYAFTAHVSIYSAQLDFLVAQERVTPEQEKNIRAMLQSEDISNGEVAFLLIDNFDDNEYSI